MGMSSWVDLHVERIVKSTAAAFLLELEDREVWIPHSCVADSEDYDQGEEDLDLSVAEWWARKEGLL